MSRTYYWLVTTNPDTGKPYLIYGGETEAEARQQGLDMLGGIDFEIKPLRTRNLQTASSMIRGKRLESTHSLSKASERIGHNRSLERLVKRRRECF